MEKILPSLHYLQTYTYQIERKPQIIQVEIINSKWECKTVALQEKKWKLLNTLLSCLVSPPQFCQKREQP